MIQMVWFRYIEGRYLRGETPVLMMQKRLKYKEVQKLSEQVEVLQKKIDSK